MKARTRPCRSRHPRRSRSLRRRRRQTGCLSNPQNPKLLSSQNFTRMFPLFVRVFHAHLVHSRLHIHSLLERPENHHMIRWDQAGEHIIVERPEQLALHVLPSVYRQSRFASFSRQLNVSRPWPFFIYPRPSSLHARRLLGCYRERCMLTCATSNVDLRLHAQSQSPQRRSRHRRPRRQHLV